MGFWTAPKRDAGSEVPPGRGGHGSVALGPNRLLVLGGADRSPQGFADLWLLELAEGAEHWTKISYKLGPGLKKPIPRSGCSLTLINGKVYIFGGQEPVSGAILDELLVLDPDSWELHAVPPAQQAGPRPPARHSHVAGVFERDSLVVFGGAGLRGPLNDVHTFDTRTHTWAKLSAGLEPRACPEPREMAAGVVISDAGLFVHGGRGVEGEILSDVAIFDGRAGKWVLIQTTPYARCAHAAVNAVPQQPVNLQQQQQQPSPSPQTSPGSSAEGTPPQQPAQQPEPEPQPQQEQQEQQPQRPASSGSGAEPVGGGAGSDRAGSDRGGGGGAGSNATPPVAPPSAQPAPPPVAANVLLYGGFSGEAVSGELLQLSFVRQSHTAGGPALKVELRPVKSTPPEQAAAALAAAGGPPGLAGPPPRFAHSMAVLQRGGEVDVVLFGGVNQTDDLNDVAIWTL